MHIHITRERERERVGKAEIGKGGIGDFKEGREGLIIVIQFCDTMLI